MKNNANQYIIAYIAQSDMLSGQIERVADSQLFKFDVYQIINVVYLIS